MANISPQRFAQLREQCGLKQHELGNILGVTAKYIGMIERGEKPVDETSSLGLLFQVQEDAHKMGLIPNVPGRSESSMVCEDIPPYRTRNRMIPVVGWAHAGSAMAYDELPASWQHKIPTECQDTKAFAVELEGDSMEGCRGLSFRQGDVLVVQPSEVPYSGCLVVARFVDDGIIFRQYEQRGPQIILAPLNERYQISTHTAEEFSWIYPVWGRWTQLWKR